ncbi:MAG: glucan biosynthesis protein D [Pseudomonadota bacterium]
MVSKTKLDRRTFAKLCLMGCAGTTLFPDIASAQTHHLFEQLQNIQLGAKQDFSLEILIARARQLSKKNWVPPQIKYDSQLQSIDYEAYQKLRFSKQKTIVSSKNKTAALQFFHLGRYFKESVQVSLVSQNISRELLYTPDFFEIPNDHIARSLPKNLGFAGFRVMESHLESDWMAFLGASYFRASTPFDQYGLSARGIAIDSGLPKDEEFPRFTAFWLEPITQNENQLNIYALLEGPSITGAYKFKCHRDTSLIMNVECHVFARKNIDRMGIAPLTSMFWYDEANRTRAIDWRPEIHDSDGLALWTGRGERIWRPLNNPSRVMTNTFNDTNPKGFGLLQRDRNFSNYQDDGVFYDKRPSLWVEPTEDWGEGSVHLVEIPTQDETFDNIVAFWTPKDPIKSRQYSSFSYKLHWIDDLPYPKDLAVTKQTQTGVGGVPGQPRPQGVKKYVIDFEGDVLSGLTRHDPVEPIITTSTGEIQNPYAYPIVGQQNQWRLVFDLKPAAKIDVTNLRAYLKYKDKALTETWLYQYVV